MSRDFVIENAEVRAWMQSAPPCVKEMFTGNIEVINFWHRMRNQFFQMQGGLDGSISDQCRESFRLQQSVCNEIIRASEDGQPAQEKCAT
jgi:hypothetical protein